MKVFNLEVMVEVSSYTKCFTVWWNPEQ